MKHTLDFRIVCSLSLAAIFILAGCGSRGGEIPEGTESPLPTPGEAANASSPIQTPSPGLPDWNAEPAPGKAILRGRIEVTQPTTVLLGELFLARAVPTSDPNIDLLELDEKTAPNASINRGTGEFIFINVEPGKYGVIAWEPMSSFPLDNPDTGETLFIELSAGQAIDIGTLYFP